METRFNHQVGSLREVVSSRHSCADPAIADSVNIGFGPSEVGAPLVSCEGISLKTARAIRDKLTQIRDGRL